MPPRVDAGLCPVRPTMEITHGMTFLVKYFNTGKNKQDLWLGVHVPLDLAPRSMTSRPKKNAHPDTPADKRAYMFYLPGKNTYAWLEKKCLFPIDDEPHPDFRIPGAENGALFIKLHGYMAENKPLKFWVAMAKKERSEKGLLNREPGFVLPSDTDVEKGTSFDSEDDASMKSLELSPVKNRVVAPANNAFLQPTLVDPDEFVAVYVGNGLDHKIFYLTRRAIGKSSILRKIVQGSPPYVMNPVLFHMETKAFELVYAFICNDSEDLGLEKVGEEDEQQDLLGDVLMLGKAYVLRDFNYDENSLNDSISDLGKTYLIASSLGLGSMQAAIIRRLQVTWNMACGVNQTLTVLDTIDATVGEIHKANPAYFKGDLTRNEPFLEWAVGFLSDLFMVLMIKHTGRFIGFLQKYVAIQGAVLAQRGQVCSIDAERSVTLESSFMMGPEHVEEEMKDEVKNSEDEAKEGETKEDEPKEDEEMAC